jgi:hypothetical protein
MFKKFMDYSLLFFISIGVIWHILKTIYLFYKPALLKRLKPLNEENPSKKDLLSYYLLTIIVGLYIINHYLKS